jgi:putative hydrolase of the HAD superfamily
LICCSYSATDRFYVSENQRHRPELALACLKHLFVMTKPIDAPDPHPPVGSLIKVVAFDAVGTLIYAEPSVSATYCRVLNELSGSPVEESFVRKVLGIRLAERSSHENLRTNEDAERQYWYDLIAELVPDANRVDACFDSLYRHFGIASNWRCYHDVAGTLNALKSAGLQLVLASNFDERLNAVSAGLEELQEISSVIISSEVGWRKPAPTFFDIVCQQTNCRPEEILFVGDDLINDIHGAKQAGMATAWIDRKGEPLGAMFGSEDEQAAISTRQMRTLTELIPAMA